MTPVRGGGDSSRFGGVPPIRLDQVTLTTEGRLTLLVAVTETHLRGLDAILDAVSEPAEAMVDIHMTTRLVSIAIKAATATEASLNLIASMGAADRSAPGQAERSANLVAHASASLQAATVRLTQMLAAGSAEAAGNPSAIAGNGHRLLHPFAVVSFGSSDTSDRNGELPGMLSIATALETLQASTTRLYSSQSAVLKAAPGAGPSWKRGSPTRAGSAEDRPPILPGLMCLVIACFLLSRATFGVLQGAAMPLAVLIVIAWCARWLAWWFGRSRDRSSTS